MTSEQLVLAALGVLLPNGPLVLAGPVIITMGPDWPTGMKVWKYVAALARAGCLVTASRN